MAERNEPKTLDQGIGVESVKVGEKPRYRIIKKKFPRTYINILHDPRVVRGNTYAAFVIPSSLQKEFMRIKEEEEKRKRMILMPPMLPRVAFLSKKKKQDEDLEEQEEKQEEDDKYYDDLEIPDDIYDNPYFYEDRPPTPQFVPLPPGREIATQIEDGELFDFDLEVESILEVLVGRSLVQARYELIEEDERREYLEHKRKYEQKREFELVNLQRSEAARIRREEEKVRRQKQAFEKRNNDIITQKKLICKTFSKSHLKFLKRNSLNHLFERGFLKENNDLRLNNLIYNNLIPRIEKETNDYLTIEKIIYNSFGNRMKNQMMSNHKSIVDNEKERLRIIEEEKEKRLKIETENEIRRKHERAEHIENKRFNRITSSIKSNIISTKNTRQDLLNIPLCDIDEFTFKNENIHCIGGQIGQAMIILDQILRKLAENNIITNDSLKVSEFIEKFLEEFLLRQLNDYQYLELRFLESSKFDFSNIPSEEEKRKEYHAFMIDDRRFVNKSLKILLEKEILTKYVYRSFMESIAKIFLSQRADPNSIEKDQNNQEDEYLKELEQKKVEIENNNKKMEKLRNKIKLNFVKPDDLKKKRDSVGGFVTVFPSKNVIDSMIETEEPVVSVNLTASTNENIINFDNNIINQQVDIQINPQENKIHSEITENPNPPTENNFENKEPVEPIKIKVDYLNEIDLFKNLNVPIDTYILHFDMTECFIAYTLRSIKRVLSKDFKVYIDLNQSFHTIRAKISEINMIIYDYVIKNEKYLGKSIITVEVKTELPSENVETDLHLVHT